MNIGKVVDAGPSCVQSGVRSQRKVVHVKRFRQFSLLLVDLAKVIARGSVLTELPGWFQIALCSWQVAHFEIDPADRIPIRAEVRRKAKISLLNVRNIRLL